MIDLSWLNLVFHQMDIYRDKLMGAKKGAEMPSNLPQNPVSQFKFLETRVQMPFLIRRSMLSVGFRSKDCPPLTRKPDKPGHTICQVRVCNLQAHLSINA